MRMNGLAVKAMGLLREVMSSNLITYLLLNHFPPEAPCVYFWSIGDNSFYPSDQASPLKNFRTSESLTTQKVGEGKVP